MNDKGCDVWLGNVRGNEYGVKHKTLNSCDTNFWNFSWDEMGKFDLTAIIDYILAITNQKKLQYIGHSQGTTILAVALAKKPEYNFKIQAAAFLAPIAFLKYVRNFFLTALAWTAPLLSVSNIYYRQFVLKN